MASDDSRRASQQQLCFEPCPRRAGDREQRDDRRSLARSRGRRIRKPAVYYSHPRICGALPKPGDYRSHLSYLGEATRGTIEIGGKRIENAAWSYGDPPATVGRIKDFVAFERNKIDHCFRNKIGHWFDEDEEVFGHLRDPRHRVDVRLCAAQFS